MSVLAACGDKNEWICALCAKCPLCCQCENVPDDRYVHINTKQAAMAFAKYARETRTKILKDYPTKP